MDLSIIIVNWNSANYLRECLNSIFTNSAGLGLEVIVVDNASYDGCGEMLKIDFPTVKFVQSTENLGFARANNLGFNHSGGRNLLFLNPDTEVIGPAIVSMLKFLEVSKKAGVVGCRLLNSNGSLQISCVQSLPTVMNQVFDAEFLRRWFPKAELWGTRALFKGGTTPTEVEAISGACMMIRREVFNQVGGFSTDYFMYTEDLDLCFKTRRAGFRNYHLGEAVIVHYGGGSSQQRWSNFSIVMMRESVAQFLRKYRGPLYSSCYKLAMSGSAVIRLMLVCILFPVWLARHRTDGWNAAFWKWLAILRWGLGLERWVDQYGRLEPATASLDSGVVRSCAESAEK